jgi:hypothetical protein
MADREPPQRRLPDIRDLTDDPRRDLGAMARTVLYVTVLAASTVSVAIAAHLVWLERTSSTHPASAYLIAAILLFAVPVTIGATVVYRAGLDMAIYVGVILVVLAWLSAMIFLAVMYWTSGWDFF